MNMADNFCEHHMYIPAGVFDGKSPSCSGCHPESAHIVPCKFRSIGVIMPEVTLDAVDYMNGSVSERLADAKSMEEIT